MVLDVGVGAHGCAYSMNARRLGGWVSIVGPRLPCSCGRCTNVAVSMDEVDSRVALGKLTVYKFFMKMRDQKPKQSVLTNVSVYTK